MKGIYTIRSVPCDKQILGESPADLLSGVVALIVAELDRRPDVESVRVKRERSSDHYDGRLILAQPKVGYLAKIRPHVAGGDILGIRTDDLYRIHYKPLESGLMLRIANAEVSGIIIRCNDLLDYCSSAGDQS